MLLNAMIFLLFVSGTAVTVGTILLFSSHKLLDGAGLPLRERLEPKAIAGFVCTLLGFCGLIWMLSRMMQ